GPVRPRALAVLGERNPQVQVLLTIEGDLAVAAGDLDAALAAYRRAHAARLATWGAGHPEVALAALPVYETLRRRGATADADAWFAAALAPLLDAPEEPLDPPRRRAADRLREALADPAP